MIENEPVLGAVEAPEIPVGAAARLRWALADGLTLVRRELWQLKGQPSQLVSELAFPAALTLLFGYVFGSAITVPGGNYRAYLMPGLFALVSAFAILANAVVISMERSRGVIDRFRSMPMARLAVPLGQTASDALTGALAVVIVVGCGLAVGWRAHGGVPRTAEALALILLFRYAMSWIGVYLGLAVRNERTVNALGPLIFPLTMISNVFVPVSHMPAWLDDIATWNPVSALAAACRQLFGNQGAAVTTSGWPLLHPVIATLAWSIGLLALFGVLAVHRYMTAES
jgi:ABC-2 type transport system permease protein